MQNIYLLYNPDDILRRMGFVSSREALGLHRLSPLNSVERPIGTV
jgi:hypothetical protein